MVIELLDLNLNIKNNSKAIKTKNNGPKKAVIGGLGHRNTQKFNVVFFFGNFR